MDPLSAPASALTLVSAVLALSKGIYSMIQLFTNAPDDLLSISNELQDLRVVLASVEMSIKATDGPECSIDPATILPTVLRRTEDKLLQLEQLLSGFCDLTQGKGFKFKSLDWSLRGKEKAKQIKDELRSLKWSISTSLGSLSASSTRRVGLALDKVSFEMQTLNNDFRQASVAFQGHQESTTLAIQDIRQSQDIMTRLLATNLDQMRADAAENGINMFITGQLHSLLPPTAVAVHLSLQQRSMCVPSCVCLCHQWRQLKSPKILDRLIGSLFIGYSGVPLVTRKCTAKSCRFKATYALKVCYRFPLWMLTHAVTLAAYCRYGQPTAGLSMAQVRPHSTQVFALAESGNVTGLKYVFDHGLASPFDISAETGDQVLHITADHGFVEASRLLLSYGADPHAYDTDYKNTPHSSAWNIILAKNISLKQRRQLTTLFPDVYASLKFSRLHELILDLKHGDLDAEASTNDFNIDAQDGEGNTALQWACLRGDAKTAQWLLVRGANPDIPSHCIGRTALMAACTSASVPCIKLLLENNADVNALNHGGLDALTYLCEEDRNPQPVSDIVEAARLLIAHGTNLEPHGPNQVCCLARAARTELVEAMELILDQGVDINRQNKFGLTALARSIAWSAHRSAEYLLRRGASYTGTDTDRRTLLHHTALNPSMDMIKVLLDARLTGLDPEATDKEGCKAEDYLNRTEGLVQGFAPAFRHLLSDVRARHEVQNYEPGGVNISVVGAEDTEDGDRFFDAWEWQQPIATDDEDNFFDAYERQHPIAAEGLGPSNAAPVLACH